MSRARDHNLVSLSRTFQHPSHDHPLVFFKQQKYGDDQEVVDCWMCEGPIHEGSNYYGCNNSDCKFYLHQICFDLPLDIHLPLFHGHILTCYKKIPGFTRNIYCNVCFDLCRVFYGCNSCIFILDIKCALALLAPNLSKFKHSSHPHPLIPAKKYKGMLNLFPCAACQETMPGPVYSCLDCKGFYLHKKCVELPPKITHPSHRKHPLLLSTNEPALLPHQEGCCCRLCEKQIKGFVYHCSHCDFDLMIKHVFSSQQQQLVSGTHQHPFNLVLRPISFTCDACGTCSGGDNIPYTCNTCNLVVHKDCIWLPKLIKILRHLHPISHSHSLSAPQNEELCCDIIRWECQICLDEVNTEYGSYYCSDCKYIVHVHCAINTTWFEGEVEDHELYLRSVPDASITSAEDVTATEIKHFSHQHILKLGDEEMMKTVLLLYCDGCMRVIVAGQPFYSCEQKICDFVLHKSCAKLVMKARHWLIADMFVLMPYAIFKCLFCGLYSSGFMYSIQGDSSLGFCLRCFGISDRLEHPGHEHRLFADQKRQGHCSSCGVRVYGGHICKYCNNFLLCYRCMSLPRTTLHKFDEHPLTLTYCNHTDDDEEEEEGDPSQCCCDICEEERDPSHRFYRCSDCNFTAHPECTLGKYPFIKRGIKFWHKDHHPHRLISVQKVFLYPECAECDKPCLDLAAECEDPGCNYICHWECLQLPNFFPIRD